MRIILSAIILTVALFSNSFSYEIDSTAGCYWEVDTFATNVRVTGTTAGTIIPKRSIAPGFDYILQTKDSIGAAADSGYTTLLIYGQDGSTVMDSIIAKVHLYANSRFQQIRFPIGFGTFGRYFKVLFTRYNATNKTNIVRAELYKRSPMTTNIDYGRKR